MPRDIVIHCPNQTHKEPVRKPNERGEVVETNPAPKILFIASSESVGKFKVQCADHRCRKASGHRSWFEITLNGRGGYEVTALPLQRFQVEVVPFVVSEM